MRKIYAQKEISALRPVLGDDLFGRIYASPHLFVPVGDDGCFFSFLFCDIRQPQLPGMRMSAYCSREALLFVSDSALCREELAKISEDQLPCKQILDLFLALSGSDVDFLEHLEDDITALEDEMLLSKRPLRGAEGRIIRMRRLLLRFKRYYEQFSLITSGFAENENSLLDDALQKRFSSLDRRLDHLLNSVLHLREYITQVREAYQAQIDIEQNQIMKIFTVLTAVFLPPTLIAGWYGMNFSLPEYSWSFGYGYVALLTLAVCLCSVLWFKHKHWF